jgi:HK97 family phage prohead protease
VQLTTRAAPFVPSTLDTSKRTVQVVWTTGARVLRGMFDRYFEELSLDPSHVRMDRLRSGAPLLDAHDAGGISSVIGVVESANLEKGRGVATVRFDTGPAGEDAMRRVAEGTLRNVSVGYRVDKLVEVKDDKAGAPVYRAVDWSPHEISIVPIGADAGAQIRSNKEPIMATKNRTRSKAAPPAEIADLVVDDTVETNERANETTRIPDVELDDRERSLGIMRVARHLGEILSPRHRAQLEQFAEQCVRDGVSSERAKAAMVDFRAEHGTLRIGGPPPMIEFGHDMHRDHNEHHIKLMAEALASRFGGPAPSDEARQYVRLSVVDLARHLLEVRGVNTRPLSKNEIVERSVGATTSDFPHLLTETGNRMLRNAYGAYTGGLQRACKESQAPDFRPINKLALGNAGALQKVNEGGEFTNSGMTESKEAYSLATFGRIFGLSRQAVVNDDLGAFAEMSTRLGRAASEFIASQLVALLVSNPSLATDSTAVFHANHGNLTGTGTAISVTSLGVALKMMRLQKGLDGTTPIDVTPKFLIVPAAQESLGLQAIAGLTPNIVSNVNPYSGKFELVVDPRLDTIAGGSTTAWYLSADPGVIDGIEYAFLDGTGPELFINQGFRVDGFEWKVRLDFGAGFIDFRGWYKNNGA